ncbi:MAG TPA: lytic transglycosylase domain-containing protein [Terriglobia bacterium]|nr:lytic transglycosylase domain-containing protein [Terriglobia bacterium]
MKHILVFATLLTIGAAARGARGMTLAQYELGWARYYAQKDGVPFDLVEAIMVVESGGDPYAVSSKGAAGVMQLMPETAYDFRVTNRFLIQENIRGGVAYLAGLIREFHRDLRLAVASYYAGDGLIRHEKLACSSPEIYNYVFRVAAIYRALRARQR